jgi:aspartate/glutamate racemase
MRLSFLHTVDINTGIFEQSALARGLRRDDLRHEVRAELRLRAEQGGREADAVQAEVADCVRRLAADADAVVVTCATLGPLVDGMEAGGIPVLRADTALARAAVRPGRRVTVLCAAPTAIEANRRLFEGYAAAVGADVKVALVPDAWDLFRQGDMPRCLEGIARAAEQAYLEGADTVAFAHPWMAPAARRVAQGPAPLDAAGAVLDTVAELAAQGRLPSRHPAP